MANKKKRRVRCFACLKLFERDKIKFKPNLYALEIFDDYKKVWMCDTCREAAEDDI